MPISSPQPVIKVFLCIFGMLAGNAPQTAADFCNVLLAHGEKLLNQSAEDGCFTGNRGIGFAGSNVVG